MPGAAIQLFWLPDTTTSRPHASCSNGTAPTPDTPSTRISAAGAMSRIAWARSGIEFITPVEVSLCVMRTALKPPAGLDSSAIRTAPGSAASPHSTSSLVTSAPYAWAIFANRSPKAPMLMASTGSPGDKVLTIAASRPPVPAQVRTTISLRVPKKGWIRLVTRSSTPANSGPRWLIIWREPASRTVEGRLVGPGIRRFVSKRSMLVSWGWDKIWNWPTIGSATRAELARGRQGMVPGGATRWRRASRSARASPGSPRAYA